MVHCAFGLMHPTLLILNPVRNSYMRRGKQVDGDNMEVKEVYVFMRAERSRKMKRLETLKNSTVKVFRTVDGKETEITNEWKDRLESDINDIEKILKDAQETC